MDRIYQSLDKNSTTNYFGANLETLQNIALGYALKLFHSQNHLKDWTQGQFTYYIMFIMIKISGLKR